MKKIKLDFNEELVCFCHFKWNFNVFLVVTIFIIIHIEADDWSRLIYHLISQNTLYS